MSKPDGSSRTSAPMIRERRMFPTLSLTASGHSTQRSCTSTHWSPRCAATAATCLVWFDCTPPIETSVSQPCASASAARYSSLRVLLPPYASPELQSSRFAQSSTPPPRCSLRRSSGCTGDGPKSSGTRGWSASGTPQRYRAAGGGAAARAANAPARVNIPPPSTLSPLAVKVLPAFALAGVVAALLPRHARDGSASPPAGMLLLAAALVTALTTGALYVALRRDLRLPVVVALTAVAYNALVVGLKFVLGP